MQIAIITIIVIGVLIYELPPLIKEHMWRETAAFLILLILGTFLAVAQVIDAKIPNPVDFIEILFTPVSDWVNNVLT